MLLLGAFLIVAIVAAILIAPYYRWQTGFVMVVVDQYQLGALNAVPFATQDKAAFAESLRGALQSRIGPDPVDLVGVRSADALRDQLGPQMRKLPLRYKDVLVAYVRGQTLVAPPDAVTVGPPPGSQAGGEPRFGGIASTTTDDIGGKACFLANDVRIRGPRPRELVPIRNIFEALGSAAPRTTLIAIDLGDIQWDPRLGVLANVVAKQLDADVASAQVDAAYDNWIIGSHDLFESSHTYAPAQRTYFARALELALAGKADEQPWGNANKVVELDEIARYVEAWTGEWVRRTSGGRNRQRPVVWKLGKGRVATDEIPKGVEIIRVVANPDVSEAKKTPATPAAEPAPQPTSPQQKSSQEPATANVPARPAPVTLADALIAPIDPAERVIRLVSADAPAGTAPAAAATPKAAGSPGKSDSSTKPDQAASQPELIQAAEPKAADAQTNDKPDQATPQPAADPKGDAAKPAEPPRPLDAWELLQAIGVRIADDDNAINYGVAGKPVPLDYAPHVWREIFSLAAAAELQEDLARMSGTPVPTHLDAMVKGLTPLYAKINGDGSRKLDGAGGSPAVIHLIAAYNAAEASGLFRKWDAAPDNFRTAYAVRNDAVEAMAWTIDYLGRSSGGAGTPAVDPALLLASIEQIGRLSAAIDREPLAGPGDRGIQVDPLETAAKSVAFQRATLLEMMNRLVDATLEVKSGFRLDPSFQHCMAALRNPLMSPKRRRAVREVLRTGGRGPNGMPAVVSIEPSGMAESADTQPRTLDRESLRNISAMTMNLVALVNAAGFTTDPSSISSSSTLETAADMAQIRRVAITLADASSDRNQSLQDVVMLGGLMARMYARITTNATLDAARSESTHVGESDSFGAMLRVMDPRDAELSSQTLLAGLPGWTSPDLVGLQILVAGDRSLSLDSPVAARITGNDGKLPPLGSTLRFLYDPADLQLRVPGGAVIAAERPIPINDLPLRVDGLSVDVVANRTATIADQQGLVTLDVICETSRRQESATAQFKLPTQRDINLLARRTPAAIEPTLVDGWVRAQRTALDAVEAPPANAANPVGQPAPPSGTAALALSAVPGRTTAWELGLENSAEIPRTVALEIHDVSALLQPGQPSAKQRARELRALSAVLLAGASSVPPLAVVEKLELPVGDGVTSVVIPPEAAPAAPQPLPAPKGDAAGDQPPAAKPIGPQLAVIIREATPGEPRRAWINHLLLQVEHPATRLKAVATWIRQDRTISVKVDAIDQDGRAAKLPAQGMRASLVPLQSETRLGAKNISIRKADAVITSRRPSDTAIAAWNGSDRDGRAWLALNVDGYPRAFVFGVDCSPPATEERQNPQFDWRNIDWLKPGSSETLVKAPAATIPLTLAVDAPPDSQFSSLAGSAADAGHLVSLTLREIRGGGAFREEGQLVWAADADRQIAFLQQKPVGAAALAVQANVTDWNLTAPGQGYENVDVEAEARLVLPGEQQPLIVRRRFIFDARPPAIEVPAAVNVVVGRPLIVPLRVLDDPRESFAQAPGTHIPGVSGVERVDWAIDAKGDGKPEAWLPAVGLGGGMYELRVPTTTVPPGRQTPLLVRATDRVGHANEPMRVWLDAAPIVAKNSIEGRVTLKGRGEEGVPVTIDGPGAPKPTRSGKDGTFKFSDLEPGDYKLQAQGPVRNQTYKSEVSPVTVAAPPAPASSATLELK